MRLNSPFNDHVPRHRLNVLPPDSSSPTDLFPRRSAQGPLRKHYAVSGR